MSVTTKEQIRQSEGETLVAEFEFPESTWLPPVRPWKRIFGELIGCLKTTFIMN